MPRRSLPPEVISFDAVISASEKGMSWDTALGLLQEMPRWALQPDVISCSAAISACEKGM